MNQLQISEDGIHKFWSKVDTSGNCWEWLGRVAGRGYGYFRVENKSQLAHRVSFAISNGYWPEGLQVDHACHNKTCVNPWHLRAVTQKENQENRRGARADNPTGARGVGWDKKSRKYRARVVHNKKEVLVGYFDDLAEAEFAVVKKRNELFTNNLQDRNG